jgi:hypothetical protein
MNGENAYASRVELGHRTIVEIPIGPKSVNSELPIGFAFALHDPIGRFGKVIAISPRGHVIENEVGAVVEISYPRDDLPPFVVTLVFKKGIEV